MTPRPSVRPIPAIHGGAPVPAPLWRDWRWQLAHRLRTPEALSALLPLTPAERRALAAPSAWRMPFLLTPYTASLLATLPPSHPLRRAHLPDLREARHSPAEYPDPLGEDAHQVAPHLIHAYPHKVLFLVSRDCATACRYCTRAHLPPCPGCPPPDPAPALRWIAAHPEITDVLLSGGDPLLLPDETLDALLASLRRIPHVRLLRIGTKVPATLPMRITPALVRILRKHRPLWLSLHFTHPDELTPDTKKSLRLLLDAGLPLCSQTVLLRHVNDDTETLRALFENLVLNGVKPYYLHYTDAAEGTAHFRASIPRGRALLRSLNGTVPGYAIPLFMQDTPGGGGKHPLGP